MMDNAAGVTGGHFAHEGHGDEMDRRPGTRNRRSGVR